MTGTYTVVGNISSSIHGDIPVTCHYKIVDDPLNKGKLLAHTEYGKFTFSTKSELDKLIKDNGAEFISSELNMKE